MKSTSLLISIQSLLFQPLENYLRSSQTVHDVKPIWIIGAPRSGTTLAYQLMCTYFKSYYLTNRVAHRYRIALVVRFLERHLFAKNELIPNTFLSEYGNTFTPSDPHEGGQFFYQFFPKDEPYSDFSSLSGRQKENFKKLVSAISMPNDLFISKNTFHSLRIKVLARLFPESAFIWIKRELDATVYSIIKARKKLNISDEIWWGIKPPGWEKALNLPVIERIIWQVEETNKIIEKDLKEMNAHFIVINYKQICDAPILALKKIANKFSIEEYVRDKDTIKIPHSFQYSHLPENTISDQINRAIK